SDGTHSVLRYNGTTGAFIGAFVPPGSGGLTDPAFLTFTRPAVTPIPAQIDVKPGGTPNSINLNANGVLAVAVLTTPTFNAASVDTSDLSRIRFGDVGVAARVSPLRSALEDVDKDGHIDLILHFSIPQIRQAGALVATSTLAELTGFTTAGVAWRG